MNTWKQGRPSVMVVRLRAEAKEQPKRFGKATRCEGGAVHTWVSSSEQLRPEGTAGPPAKRRWEMARKRPPERSFSEQRGAGQRGRRHTLRGLDLKQKTGRWVSTKARSLARRGDEKGGWWRSNVRQDGGARPPPCVRGKSTNEMRGGCL